MSAARASHLGKRKASTNKSIVEREEKQFDPAIPVQVTFRELIADQPTQPMDDADGSYVDNSISDILAKYESCTSPMVLDFNEIKTVDDAALQAISRFVKTHKIIGFSARNSELFSDDSDASLQLVGALVRHPELVTLDLSATKMFAQHFAAMVSGLNQNTTLVNLDLSENWVITNYTMASNAN